MACVTENYTTQLPIANGDTVPAYSQLAEEALQTLSKPAQMDVLRAMEDKFAVEQTLWSSVYLCSNELLLNIHHTMRGREFGIRPLQLQSPHLQNREYLVDLITMVSELLGISPRIRFLAVLLLDHFMDSHIVMEFRLKLVALTCLYVAAKFEERDDRIPSIESLQHCAQFGQHNCFTIEEVHKMELYLLQFYNWCISYPTAMHFADIYLTIERNKQSREGKKMTTTTTTTSDLAAQCHSSLNDSQETAFQSLAKHASYFLEASLRDYNYLQYTSSQVAAAAISASHVCLGSRVVWSEELEKLTGYSTLQLTPIVDQMLGLHGDMC